MNIIAQSAQYPVTCPTCNTINAKRAVELLQHKILSCRKCESSIAMSESQLNSLRRTLADMGNYLRQSQPETMRTD
ncbi:MAG: hypothetical protein LRY66_09685 [Saccharospirillaceae bacterium]|nr:hypothetical protein [Saccharospirillaceae bacterium]MCD8531612.1 hypothetical protein [Saccharospirillaceae bacterium]